MLPLKRTDRGNNELAVLEKKNPPPPYHAKVRKKKRAILIISNSKHRGPKRRLERVNLVNAAP